MNARARAAARLRHDLGRYIRFWAPETLETDTEALRERLIRDVLSTRSGPSGTIPAADVFDAWLAEEGSHFEDGSAALTDIRQGIDALRGLAARLPELQRAELEELDGLTRSIAEGCRRLSRESGLRR
jgi:hypothetical protein